VELTNTNNHLYSHIGFPTTPTTTHTWIHTILISQWHFQTLFTIHIHTNICVCVYIYTHTHTYERPHNCPRTQNWEKSMRVARQFITEPRKIGNNCMHRLAALKAHQTVSGKFQKPRNSRILQKERHIHIFHTSRLYMNTEIWNQEL